MKKLVKGIIEFRQKKLPSYKDTFAKLALGQKPDALFIGCSDSRVAVNVFASTDPGDLFVNRNVGNIVPPYRDRDQTQDGVAAVIEFALETLKVKNIIICGHSECGAMMALNDGLHKITSRGLQSWLANSESVLEWLKTKPQFASELPQHNRLSQLNVLKQIENLKTYTLVQNLIKAGELKIHGWWFDIAKAEVYSFDDNKNAFFLIEENEESRNVLKM